MATYFVSNAGSNTAPYDTEAKAATSLSTIAAIPWTNADTVKISSTHTESTGGAITYTMPTAPGLKILSVAFDGSGTGGLAVGASVTNSTNATAINFASGYAYIYGVIFNAATGTSASNIIHLNSTANVATGLEFISCTFRFAGSSTSSRLVMGNAGTIKDPYIKLINCTHSSSAAGARSISIRNGIILLDNFSYVADSGTFTRMFALSAIHQIELVISNTGFTQAATSMFQIAGCDSFCVIRCINCTIPSGAAVIEDAWDGPGAGYLELIDCAEGDAHYKYYKNSWHGTIEMSNSVYANGTDGVEGISLKMDSSASASYLCPLEAPLISYFNKALVPTTITVECVNDGTTFKDNELWQETSAKITSGYTKGTWDVSSKAGVLDSASDQPESSATWTGVGGFGAAVKQKLVSGEFTPAEVGSIIVAVKLAKPSSTVYISPRIAAGAKQVMSVGGTVVNESAVSSGPAEVDVRDGVAYTIDDAAYEGTLDLPAEADVKDGVTYDNETKTGELASGGGIRGYSSVG